jgi:acyl carrier protein
MQNEETREISDLAISSVELAEYMAKAVKEIELEQSDEEYYGVDSIDFAPPDTQEYRDFIAGCDNFGE